MATSRDGALAGLLLLADGRFPTGAYAHSGGLEPAVIDDRVRDFAGFEAFLAATIETTGVMVAGFAAAACAAVRDRKDARLRALEAALDARLPSPAQRATSRLLGRQLRRAVVAISADGWLDYRLDVLGRDPHRPLALGAVAAMLGLQPRDAALAALHEVAAGVVAAAIRLLGLDPLAAYATLARTGPRLDALAATAAETAHGEVDLLPAPATPMLDLYAEQHALRATRMFSS